MRVSALIFIAAASVVNAAGSPCASVVAASATYVTSRANPTTFVKPSLALACLESVPLNANLSAAFIDYITPHLQFQSTISYLKDPPKGWTLAGVDIYGGLNQIKSNLGSGAYANQWEFEKDLWTLINVLPHDFHFNLPLPLLEVFTFQSRTALVSVSNGTGLPGVYFFSDFSQLTGDERWTPSAVTKINGQGVDTFLQTMSVTTDNFNDPDGLYNRLFYNPAAALRNQFGQFWSGGWPFGFDNDTISYSFENGTTLRRSTWAAILPSTDLTGVTDGADLFRLVEVLPNALQKRDVDFKDRTTRSMHARQASSDMEGYPTPVIVHPEDPYTAGFILDSGLAVLSLSAFAPLNSSSTTGTLNMQITVAGFLAQAKKAGSKRLIVDLSANGGGAVYSGYDTFKQLLPAIVPYGASRLRTSPWIDYMGDVYSLSGIYNSTFQPPWSVRNAISDNLTNFGSFKDFGAPSRLYGDNFFSKSRLNLSDTLTANGFSVYGYGTKTAIPAAVFEPENIIMLMDGTCGSTCTIFAELMRTQGGIRSVSVGGRPQTGPMQGTGGSKGSQVQNYAVLEYYSDGVTAAAASAKGAPKAPTGMSIPPSLDSSAPLGSKNELITGARVNFRNAFRAGDTTETPLQFTYDATNCRIFYQPDDIFAVENLWSRVANVTWEGDLCVEGSSTGTNGNTMNSDALSTVAYDPKVNSKVTVPPSSGLVAMGSGPGTGAGSGVTPFKTIASSTSGASTNVVGGSLALLMLGVGFLLF